MVERMHTFPPLDAEDSGIKLLMPRPGRSKEEQAHRRRAQILVREIVAQAAVTRDPSDLLLEVYLAGLWHGAELQARHNMAGVS